MTEPDIIGKVDRYIESNQFEDAIILLLDALENRPEDALIHSRLGHCFGNKQLHKLALNEYKIASKLDPNNPDLYYSIGLANGFLGSYEDSIIFLNKAIELKDDEAEYYYVLGNAYLNQGQEKDARISYNKALKLNPYHKGCRQNIDYINNTRNL